MHDAPDLASLREELARSRSACESSERRLRALHGVSRVLADEPMFEAAMPRVLEALGTALGCAIVSYWTPAEDALELIATWCVPGIDQPAWEAASRRARIVPGAGLPGRIWRDAGLAWISDLDVDTNLPRRQVLHGAGIASGFGFPVMLGARVAGVIELFSRNPEPIDDHLAELLRTLGIQLGQYVLRSDAQGRMRRQIEQRHHMSLASERFAASLDPEAILADLARAVTPWLADWCVIYLAERDGGLRRVVTMAADPELGSRAQELQQRYPPSVGGRGWIQTAIRERRAQLVDRITPAVLADFALDPEHLEMLRELELGSFAIVPIIVRGQAIGTLNVYTSDTRRRLSTEDLALLDELVWRAGLAVANAQLYRELDLERASLEKLNAVGQTIAAELDRDKLAQAVSDAATELTGAELGALFYDVAGTMRFAVSGMSRERFAHIPMPRNTPLLAPTLTRGATVRLADVTRDPRYGKNTPRRGIPDNHPIVRSYLAVPIQSRRGPTIGGILLGHSEPNVFSERAERLARAIAAHAATALDNSQLYGEAQHLITALEKTNKELDQFAYVASHDLRAPLRGIANLATWLEEDLPADTAPTIREMLRLLKGRAARMDKLISGLLELARVGRARQQPERVDVTELLHETIDLLAPPPAARILIVGAMPTMVAERPALQQVFLNLLANSLQHSARDDVVVRISSIERPEEYELAVADNGVGIAPEHRDRVWDMFETLASRDTVDSAGIGLAIVRKQVEANGGRVWFDPTTQGATVRFTWPKPTK